jgi:hypothetical protein
MAEPNVTTVRRLIADAASAHHELLSHLPAELQISLPVDAQGVTQAIDHLAVAAGLTQSERLELIKPHAVNPAVLHARVFGRAPLARETVIGSFVDGARVRADALGELADVVGGEELGAAVRGLLIENPPPVESRGPEVVVELRATYAAQERAAMMIAARLDADSAQREL